MNFLFASKFNSAFTFLPNEINFICIIFLPSLYILEKNYLFPFLLKNFFQKNNYVSHIVPDTVYVKQLLFDTIIYKK